MTTLHYDDLAVSIHADATALGAAMADQLAGYLGDALAGAETVGVILATGNSQIPLTEALAQRTDVDWSRVEIFHMDEYLGIGADHPASFRRWMRERIVEPLGVRAFHGIDGDAASPEQEARRYARLLAERPPRLAVMGVGENGHLAFNDPPADFFPTDLVRVVEMDERSRKQQVGEGHFPSLEQTPTHALSLTIPALLARHRVLVGVPERRKAQAVQRALEEPVTRRLPASVLRLVPHAHLHLDRDAASSLRRAHGTAA